MVSSGALAWACASAVTDSQSAAATAPSRNISAPRVPMALPPLRTDLAQRRHLERVEVIADGARNEARGDRGTVVVQDRHQPHRVDVAFVDDERAQLRIAVLLDHEHEVMLSD